MKRLSTKRERGNSIFEFAIVSVIIVPLMFGTVGLGLQMGHSIQVLEACRDMGHMYANGIDFSQSSNQSIAVTLAEDPSMTATSGNDVMILSEIITVYQADCNAGNHASDCTNLGQNVIRNRIVIGNSSLRLSNYGTPSSSIIDSSGNIAANDYLTNTSAVATNFSNVLAAGSMTLPQGYTAFLSEMYRQTPDLSYLGLAGSQGVYASFVF